MSEATAVRERPILFSGPMVKAILDGRKTQTRRILNPQPHEDYSSLCGPSYYEPTIIGRNGEEREGPEVYGVYAEDGEFGIKCPFEPGMLLWVRETWAESSDGEYDVPVIVYRAGGCRVIGAEGDNRDGTWREFLVSEDMEWECHVEQWRPSIFMPRWASRITLEITDVRVERLQSISAKDIVDEGVVLRAHEDAFGHHPVSAFDGCVYMDLKSLWASGWDSINGKSHPWASNPWVWAISFRRLLNEPAPASAANTGETP